ncbi:MAG: ABC transporter ATP-binding protein/permease [Oscillospiraceae bacterium]|jgi:ATP-binding cassette subfamily B protein|nr:ABC transporter ATP-binding protein/permease [Oscillospiraceae bacterium]
MEPRKNTEGKLKAAYLIKRFFPYFKPYAGLFFLDLLCASLTTLCELVLPLIIRDITNMGMSNMAALTVSYIIRTGVLYMALRFVDAAASWYMDSYGHIMGSYIETNMRSDLFRSMQHQSFSFYSETKIGQVMARLTSDLNEVTEFAHHFPENMFVVTIKLVASFVILLGMNVWLTLIVFACLPLTVLSTRFFYRRMITASRAQRKQIGELNASVEDSLLGHRVVQSFANQPIEQEKFERGNQLFLNVKRVWAMNMGGFGSINRIIQGFMYIMVVVVGSLFMRTGRLNAADLVAYLLYITTLLSSVREMVNNVELFQRGMTGIERFCELTDAPVEIVDTPDAVELADVKGEITFENVKFSYPGERAEVLHGINQTVTPGESVAIVGPSGGGKTTLLSLIPRFYDVTDGRILVDGHDVRDISIKSLRTHIGVVQQDVYLFSGTILDNILYGRPGATREEVIEAAKLADAHRFIEAMPNGYDTHIGERGVKLSGGQKQRVSIARVFLKNPPVLILDEATSALDNESEWVVQQSLERLAKGRTTFTIAHRLTTIRNADVIWVLTDEGVAERGTHDELIRKRGAYYDLYHQYLEVAS